MYRLAFALALLIVGSPALAQNIPSMPDSDKTPGVALRKVPDAKAAACLTDKVGDTVEVGDTITLEMICADGYTKCIRNVATATKQHVYDRYGLTGGNHTAYCDSDQGCEVDHLIALEIGGSNDEKNLWPEPYQGETLNAHVKDRLERWLHNEVCGGKMSLQDAQKEIATDWIASFRKHIGNN